MSKKERWSAKDHPKRAAVHALIAFAVGLASVFIVIKVTDKAYGSEPVSSTASYRCATDSTAPCHTVTRKMKRVARRYRAGVIHHGHGFAPRRMFRNPRASRRIIIRKIARAVAKAEGVRRMDPGSDACAYEGVSCARLYDNLADHAGCTSLAQLDYQTGWDQCHDAFGYSSWGGKLTKHQTQIGAVVGVCAGQIIIEIATGGGATAVTASSLGAGCIVGLWTWLDP